MQNVARICIRFWFFLANCFKLKWVYSLKQPFGESMNCAEFEKRSKAMKWYKTVKSIKKYMLLHKLVQYRF